MTERWIPRAETRAFARSGPKGCSGTAEEELLVEEISIDGMCGVY